jgi:Legume lectin domain/PEP-CTERM motif
MSNPGGINPADGFTFVLAANPTGLGGEGFGLGYAGVPNSVAIEFDTFYNGPGSVAGNGASPNRDDLDSANNPSSNHVAIDTSGHLTNTDLTNVYGIGSCGFTTGTPVESSNAVPGCLSNGDVWTANISYNGSQLSVVLRDPTEGASFVALSNVSIDLASLLGTDQAFVGFTASTGAGNQDTDILDWSFANTTQLAGGGVPEPASWALMIAGFGLIGAAARRSRRLAPA